MKNLEPEKMGEAKGGKQRLTRKSFGDDEIIKMESQVSII